MTQRYGKMPDVLRTSPPASSNDVYDAAKSNNSTRRKGTKKSGGENNNNESLLLLDQFVEDFMKFIDAEFSLILFAMLYAVSIIIALLACTRVIKGLVISRLFLVFWVPWFLGATMYLIDPRVELWSFKFLLSLGSKLKDVRTRGEVLSTVRMWWMWRKKYKTPPRVHCV